MPSSALVSRISSGISMIRHVCYMDFSGDPVRAHTGLYDVTFSGTGDPDLDGHVYSPVPGEIVEISPVEHAVGGSGTVTVSLSGLLSQNSDLMTVIGDTARWQGRVARLWWYDEEAGAPFSAEVVPYYTGRMSSAVFSGSGEGQVIRIEVEGYLSALSGASGRTYAGQSAFDPADTSAIKARAVFNGTSAVPSAARTQYNFNFGGFYGF